MRFMKPIAVAAALAATVLTFAGAAEAGDITIHDAWSRATPPSAKVGAGYMVIENKGAAADRLMGGSTPVAGRLEVHEMTMTGGIMKMRGLADGLEVPAGGEVALKPGSYHLMLLDLKQPLKEGDTVPVTLTFKNAGTMQVDLTVKAVGAGAPGHGAGHGMKMQ